MFEILAWSGTSGHQFRSVHFQIYVVSPTTFPPSVNFRQPIHYMSTESRFRIFFII